MNKKFNKTIFNQIQSYYKFHNTIKQFFENGKIEFNSEFINKEINLYFIDKNWIQSWKGISNYENIVTLMKEHNYDFLDKSGFLNFDESFYTKFEEGDSRKNFLTIMVNKLDDFDNVIDESNFELFKIFQGKEPSSDWGKISCLFYENMIILLIRDYKNKSRIKIFYKGITEGDTELIQLMKKLMMELKNCLAFFSVKE